MTQKKVSFHFVLLFYLLKGTINKQKVYVLTEPPNIITAATKDTSTLERCDLFKN